MNEERIWEHLEKLNEEVGELCKQLTQLEVDIGKLETNIDWLKAGQKAIFGMLIAIAVAMAVALLKSAL